MWSRIGMCIWICCWAGCLQAQEPAVWLEEWLEEQDAAEEQLQEEVLEELSNLQSIREPIDLNRANRSQLEQSGLFSFAEIDALLAHRERFGKLLAWFELQAIPNFSVERIEALAPYCLVSNGHQRGSIAYSFKNAQHRLLIRSNAILQAQAGYNQERQAAGNSHYAGSRNALLMRYRSTGKRHSLALNASRDPGEQGIDRLGGHLLLRSQGRLEQVVVGDFHLQAGHGLLANTGFMPGRSAGIAASFSSGSLLLGATGNQAYGAYRGIAAQYRLSETWQLMMWQFRMRWSASIEVTEEAFEVMSISKSGRHRTPSERERRNNLQVWGQGVQLQYRRKHWVMQGQLQRLRTGSPLAARTEWYRHFDPQGDRFVHASFSHRYQRNRWQFYGEVSTSQFQHIAILQNAILNISSKLQSQVSYRNYPAAYHSFFANSIRAGSSVNNEQGWLWMLAFQPSRRINMDYYLDLYAHPWLRYRVDGPSTGVDQRVQIQYRPDKLSRLSIRLRHSVRERNLAAVHFRAPEAYSQWRTTGQWQQQFSETWQLLLRVDKNFFVQSSQMEEAFSLTYRLKWQAGPWRISWQQTHFDAALFDNRFYVSEPDVLYGQGIGMLSGRGVRSIMVVQYRYRRGLDFWLRYAQSSFHDRENVGSGLELSVGRLRSELRFQLQYRF